MAKKQIIQTNIFGGHDKVSSKKKAVKPRLSDWEKEELEAKKRAQKERESDEKWKQKGRRWGDLFEDNHKK